MSKVHHVVDKGPEDPGVPKELLGNDHDGLVDGNRDAHC